MNVKAVLRCSGYSGGILRAFSIAQHLEISSKPLFYLISGILPRPDLVLCTQPLFSGFGGYLCMRGLNVPFFVMVHGEELTGAWYGNSCGGWRKRLIKRVLDNASGVICSSANTGQLARELYDVRPELLHVIVPAINAAEMDAVSDDAIAKIRVQVGPGKKMVFMAGRISQQHKGFDKAIESLPHICTQIPDVRLVIAGPGDQTPLRRLAVAFGVADKVLFLGEVTREMLLRLFSACDLFLLPGRALPEGAEGFGVVYLEAAFYGRPVVAGKAGGVGEAVQHQETGLLVDGNRPDEIAAAVVRILADPDYGTCLGRAGAVRIRREFSAQAAAERLREVLEGPARKPSTLSAL